MSTVYYLKDHENCKAGTLGSVPFLVGKELLAAGIARYPAKGEVPQPLKAVAPAPQVANEDKNKKAK